MSDLIQRATDYIKQNKHRVNPIFRPSFHLVPPIGWMNDPNGFIHYRGAYHLFYQYHPYSSAWGPMHWGHSVSTDLLRYSDAPIAMAPDHDDEHGCFSGGAVIEKNTGNLILMYTKHYENGFVQERQNIAVSKDGCRFVKQTGFVLGEKDLPPETSRHEFRDPRPIFIDPYYYVLIGSSSTNGVGQLLVYRSKDMRQFEYHFTIGPHPYFGKMAECPDLLFFPEGDVLLVSSIGLPQEGGQYRNVNSSLALIGRFDLPNRYYEIDAFHEIDKGHAFYAPQATKTPQGDYVMTAWMNMWAKPYYPAMQQHMWSGSLVLPRLVSIKDKRLVQTPINALERYHKPLAFNENSLIRKAFDLHLTMDCRHDFQWRIEHVHHSDDYVSIESHQGTVVLDTSHTKNFPLEARTSCFKYARCQLRLIVDNTSFELFIDDGRETITSLAYLDSEHVHLKYLGNKDAIIDKYLFEIDMPKEGLHEKTSYCVDDAIHG